MRGPTTLAVGLLLASAALAANPPRMVEDAAPGKPLHIVAPGGPIAPGEAVALRAEPPPAPSEHEFWSIVSGPGRLVNREGKFKAPYLVSAGGAVTVVQVARGPRGAVTSATAELRIQEGSFPGAESCAGPDQAHVPEPGDYVRADELPELIVRVAPEYPAKARARGITGTLIVNALVCSSGQVIDGYGLWPEGSTPDVSLEESALAAARQYLFKPALVAGKPVAVWVATPFRFPPP